MRIHLAGVIFKTSSISRVRSEDEHCHYGAAALTRNELALTSLVSGGRGGKSTDPTSSRVLPITASIWRVNSSPKGLKIAARCVVIGSDGSPTTSQEIWQRPSSNSCSKMKHIRPGIGKTLLLERYVWWLLKAGLAFHFGRLIKRIITYVRPLSSNNSGRRARQALPHSDPKADRFTHRLQYRP
jgi:hypothetical protein